MKVAFYTLGCKVNQYETQAMAELLASHGYDICEENGAADVYVINSCTVTAESDRKTRQAVRRFKRNHPDSVVVLTGCLPQAFPEQAEALYQADIVLGNKNNAALPRLLNEYFISGSRVVCVEPHEQGEKCSSMAVSGFRERTRAVVKIEDGCNRFCSYCIIPYARGRVRSKPPEELKKELLSIESRGFAEVVLVGINLSAYGTDINKNLCDAVSLACSFEKISRVRLGSLEPDHITEEFISRLSKEKKLCPQFHISLQSGCNKTLERMNRRYSANDYRKLCGLLRSSFPDATLTTDVMVGFPGETDEDFLESLEFVREIGFERIHVFPYSPRAGTKAAEFKDQIPRQEKEKRSRIMIAAAEELQSKFLISQTGKTVEILVEEITDNSCIGYTPNYTQVEVANCTKSGLLRVKINGVLNGRCSAEEIT